MMVSDSHTNYPDSLPGRRSRSHPADNSGGAAQARETFVSKVELLREVHHRVKNNTQLMVSLVNMAGDDHNTDPATRDVLQNVARRIREISFIHDYLYDSPSMERINFSGFIRKAVSELQGRYPESEKIRFTFSLQEEALGVDKAIACGIIIHELLANAFKHAFLATPPQAWQRAPASIGLHTSVRGDRYHISFADNGTGISIRPDGFPARMHVGFRMVQLLVKEYLGGEIRYVSDKGTQVHISFKHRAGSVCSFQKNQVKYAGGDGNEDGRGFMEAWQANDPRLVRRDENSRNGYNSGPGEMGVLLDEIYHRQKKNIRIILNILQTAGQQHQGLSSGLGIDRAYQSIYTLFRVHQHVRLLHGVEYVDFNSLLEDLCNRHFSLLAREDEKVVSIQAGCNAILMDQAVPLALIANDLFFQVKKWPDKTVSAQGEGRLQLVFRRHRQGNYYELELFDQNPDCVCSNKLCGCQSIALNPIASISRDQLGGRFSFGSGPDSSLFRLRFPVSLH